MFSCRKYLLYRVCCITFFSSAETEWESGGSSGDCLLQAVCRCSLAALLRHSGLQSGECWQDRSEAQNHNY